MSIPRKLLQSSTPQSDSQPRNPLDSGTIVIVAALLCAFVTFAGLAAIVRCTWLQRRAAEPPKPPKKGVKRKVLESFPKFVYEQGSAVGGKTVPADCPICLAEFAKGDEVRMLPRCGHAFHAECIDKWLLGNSSCPSCRHVLVGPTTVPVAGGESLVTPVPVVVVAVEAPKAVGSATRCLP